MRKGTASRGVRWVRERIKRGCAYLVAFFFRARSYSIFGVPCGLTSAPTKPLYPEKPVDLHPPTTSDASLFWSYRLALETPSFSEGGGIVILSDAIATALGGNLTKQGRLVTTYLQPIDGKPPHRHDVFCFSTKRFFPRIFQTDKVVATLATGWQDAFYHWMHEVLPRLHLVEQSGYLFDTLFVATQTQFQQQSLELVGLPTYDVINANAYDAVAASRLIIPSIPEKPTEWSCQFLRERFIPKLQPHSQKKRLYISRNDAPRRRVVNEEEVYACLTQYGFERIELSALPLKEQMELFHAAEIIVGPHGAGFSHLVFCKPGTPFLEFFHPHYVNICYWHLCNVMKHPYCYLLGEENMPCTHSGDPDIIVDVGKLESLLGRWSI